MMDDNDESLSLSPHWRNLPNNKESITMPIRPSAMLLAALLAAPMMIAPVMVAPARAAPATGPSRVLTGADLFNLEVASDPQIAPDGRTIVYVRRANDIMVDRTRASIWSIDVASGEQTPLIAGAGSHGEPRWSRDGSKLAYVSKLDDKDDAQLYVRWMRTGVTARITGLPATPNAIAWSPDGKRIAYAMFVPDEATKLGKAPDKPEGANWAEPLQVIDTVVYRTDEGGYNKPGYEQIFWVPADGGAPTQLTFGARNAGGRLSWSPDGRSVLFSANLTKDWQREAIATDVHEVSIDDLSVRTLTHRNGPNDQPMVSPDGKSIAYVGFEDRYVGYQDQRLSVMNRDGSGSRVLTANLDRNVADPLWAADGRSVYVDYDEHGSVRVARVGLDGSVRTIAEHLTARAFDRPYSGGEFSVARDGAVAFTSGTTQRPSDVWVARDGHPRQLTHLNQGLAAKKLGDVQHFEVAAFDKLPIEQRLLQLAIIPNGQEVAGLLAKFLLLTDAARSLALADGGKQGVIEKNDEFLAMLEGHLAASSGYGAAIANLKAVLDLAQSTSAAGRVLLDLSLVRGLSYYTGAIMEIAVEGIGSLGGGGRYDNLVGMFLGRDVPACGFSLGLERIIVLMTERNMFPAAVAGGAVDILVTLWNDESRTDSVALAADLRKSGLRVDVYPEADKLGKQFKYASSRNAPFVAILGDEERARGDVAVKDLRSGEQTAMPRDNVAGFVATNRERRT